jgi:hypothetical protein
MLHLNGIILMIHVHDPSSIHFPGPTFELPQLLRLAHACTRKRCSRTCVLPTLNRMSIRQPCQKVTRM